MLSLMRWKLQVRFSCDKRAENTDEHRKQCLWLVINKGQWWSQWIPLFSQNRPPMHTMETVLYTTQRRSVHAVSLRRKLLSVALNGSLCWAEQINVVKSSRDSPTELTSPNDSWDLEFTCLIFSYYIIQQQGKLEITLLSADLLQRDYVREFLECLLKIFWESQLYITYKAEYSSSHYHCNEMLLPHLLG